MNKLYIKLLKKSLYTLAFAILFSAVLSITSNKVFAGTCSWDGSTDNDWNDATNWGAGCTGAGGIPADGDDLIFPLGMPNRSMDNDISGLDLRSLTFQDDYAIGGSSISLSHGMSSNSQVTFNIQVTASTLEQTWEFENDEGIFNSNLTAASNLIFIGLITVNGVLNGNGDILVSGNDTNLYLNNSNTFTGDLVSEGNVIVSDVGALGGISNVATFNGGDLFVSDSSNIVSDLILNDSSTIQSTSGSTIISGDIEINGVVLVFSDGGNLDLGGVISGSGDLRKDGPDILTLSGGSDNTLSGNLVIDDGTLVLNKTSALVTAGNLQIGNSLGDPGTAILSFDQDAQIPNDASVQVFEDGYINFNGHEDFFDSLEINEALVDVNGGNIVVLYLQMIGGEIMTGLGEIGVADTISLTGGISAAVEISGNLDLGAVGAGIDFSGANTGLHPDAIISADIFGTSNINYIGGDISFSGDNSLYTGDITINNGELSIDGNSVNADIFMSGSGVLRGDGGSIKSLTAYTGFIAPGNSPGTLVVDNTMALSSGDTLTFELDGILQGTEYDYIHADELYLNDAILDIVPGAIFAPGDTFIILTADSEIHGTFGGRPEGTVFEAGGQFFQIHYDTTAVTLEAFGLILMNPSNVSSITNPIPGQAFTVTSTWNSNGGITPTGTATLFNGTTNLGTVSLVGGVATFNNITLSAGTHTLSIEYSGDSNFGAAVSYPLLISVSAGNLSGTGVNLPIGIIIVSMISFLCLFIFIEIKVKNEAFRKY